jgi:hypothetical protein
MAMMNASDVVELLSRLEQCGIEAWLNGGWGVDAHGRLVDVHLVDFSTTTVSESGVRAYGPAGLPFEVGSKQEERSPANPLGVRPRNSRSEAIQGTRRTRRIIEMSSPYAEHLASRSHLCSNGLAFIDPEPTLPPTRSR